MLIIIPDGGVDLHLAQVCVAAGLVVGKHGQLHNEDPHVPRGRCSVCSSKKGYIIIIIIIVMAVVVIVNTLNELL